MVLNKSILSLLVSGILGWVVFTVNANSLVVVADKKPEFAGYSVSVSSGPFATKLNLTNEQNNYSEHWKNMATAELSKTENMSGHYRIFTDVNSNGNECIDHSGGVCGWIIDKLSGNVVASLPFVDGTNIYNQVADNGTPVGEEFRINTQKNSSLIVLTGQGIPQKIEYDKDGLPISYSCKTTYYVFKNNQFSKIFEDKNGCSVD